MIFKLAASWIFRIFLHYRLMYDSCSKKLRTTSYASPGLTEYVDPSKYDSTKFSFLLFQISRYMYIY